MKKTKIYYDKEGDFLEIIIGKPTECYAEEVGSDIIIRTDEKTKEVKSIGILNFKKNIKNLNILKISN